MGTTTKMAIPYPEATGLVKDGWEDMKDIADQVDAKSGLVLLSTNSFTGVSSVSLPANTFSSNFNSYKIILDLESVTGTNPQLTMRLRASGVDASGSNYLGGGVLVYRSQTTFYSLNDNGTTSINFGQVNAGDYMATSVDLINPFATKFTNYLIQAVNADSTNVFGLFKGGTHDLTTSYDSLSFIIGSGNFAGVLTAYGYNK